MPGGSISKKGEVYCGKGQCLSASVPEGFGCGYLRRSRGCLWWDTHTDTGSAHRHQAACGCGHRNTCSAHAHYCTQAGDPQVVEPLG